jgi:alpha-1,3-rhamnosyl/mannosyltransferase
VLVVSERTKRDVIELYGLAPERITVTPHGVDPAFTPGGGGHDGYALFVGAVQQRKDPLAALAAARAAQMTLVVAGPEKDAALARQLRAGGADVRGYVSQAQLAELYRRAAALLLPSRYEGFGLPVLEAMASGTPVVLSADAALREVAGDAGLYGDLADGLRRAVAEREHYVRAGLERARLFSWDETARRTADVYRELLG